jgi:predicted MPP superfamily phosphohydrolase
MKVGILHLSDIHIENEKDWIIDKARKIAQAALGTWERLNVIFVVISGDIANKGLQGQYSVANEFFSKIRDYFQKESQAKVFFIAAPGNHDCDFSENDGDLKARKSFIDTVLRDPNYIERGDSIYKGCLEVQKNFFQFARDLDPQINYPAEPEVFYQVGIKLDRYNFYFNIFNSAWLSEKNEDQGALVFPTHLINLDAEKLSDSAFSVSVFHHPDNWLESNNSLPFRRLTEKHSDIILSGHEHKAESVIKKDAEANTETQIIKAGALQERSRPTSSTFNLIVVDLDSKKQQSFPFKWKGAEYKSGKGSGWQDFVRNRFLQSKSLGSLVVKAGDFSRALTTQHTSSLNDC